MKRLETVPSKRGVLFKLGGGWKAWKPRLFVLHDQVVLYYESEAETDPTKAKGMIFMDGAAIHRLDASKHGKDLCMEITHPERRSFVLQAHNVNLRNLSILKFAF